MRSKPFTAAVLLTAWCLFFISLPGRAQPAAATPPGSAALVTQATAPLPPEVQPPAAFVPTNMFSVPDDLEVTLWAKSPLFRNPTNMDIDAQGRIWITEAMNYRRH